MNNFNYKPTNSVQQALKEKGNTQNSMYIAGGTNVIDLYKYNLAHPDLLLDLSKIEDHHAIDEKREGGMRLGAFAKNADTAYHPLIQKNYPLLSKAILAGASAQIRNMATNGGNLLQRTRCYYFYDENAPCNKRNPGTGCPAIEGYNRIHAILGWDESCIAVFPSDMCVALAALDAKVNISGENGERDLTLEEFHRLPNGTPERDNTLQHGEIVTSIDLPEKGFADNYSYLKIRDRNSYAFALVSVATGLHLVDGKIAEARIALGGVAHKPWRVKEAEHFLMDKVPDEASFEGAADIILEGAKGFKHNAFKINLAKRAIIRNCMMALHPETQLPGAKPSL